MLFNSPLFLYIFLPVSLIGFAVLGRFGRRSVIGWLTFCSIVFYLIGQPASVLWLLGSILGNYFLSRLIVTNQKNPRTQSFWLSAGIVANLAALGYFKYLFPLLGFLTHLGFGHHQWANAILPLGISFFTFTQMGYLIDLKQGEAEPLSLVGFAFFVTFFPHLIAGPFLHFKEIMPQLAEERRYGLNRDDFTLGLTWFIMGLFKKVMIADMIAPFSNAVFDAPGHQSAAAAWIGALSYMLELYFDFSGYSDMAIGLARMFSIRLPFNFNSPYKAGSVTEFWSRWHMTLTRFVTLFVFTPLSLAVSRFRIAKGKKVSLKASKTIEGFSSMVAYPTMVTMLIIGAWHGAGIQFLIFGLIHGICMIMERAWLLFKPPNQAPVKAHTHALYVLRVNLIALLAFVFFRSFSTQAAFTLLQSMFGWNGSAHQRIQPLSLMVILLLPVIWFLPNTQQILGEGEAGKDSYATGLRLHWRPNPFWAIAMAVGLFFALIDMNADSTFLYFQF